MSKKSSATVARLIDEYISGVQGGQSPAVADLLARCPEGEREDLRLALIGAHSLLEHHWQTYVSPKTVDDTLAEMKRIRERKQRLHEAERRLTALSDQVVQDPIDVLRISLDLPIELVRDALAARRAGAPVATWLRAQADLSQRSRRILDREAQRMLEQRMEERAAALLDRYNLCQVPIDLEALARRLGLAVRDALLNEDVDGCLVAGDDYGAILLNRRVMNQQRRRFTLAHEIAHFILHRKSRVFRDKMNEMGILSNNQEEVEANTLAAMLLMPPEFIPASYVSERPTFARADELAETFDVSLLAALRRLVRMSHQACALVFIRDGRIRWWAESNYFDYFIPVNREPHPDSAAAVLARRPALGETILGVREDTTLLPLSAWVNFWEDEESEARVWEESRYLPGGYIYSLITCLE